jgi:hypothetical protein
MAITFACSIRVGVIFAVTTPRIYELTNHRPLHGTNLRNVATGAIAYSQP